MKEGFVSVSIEMPVDIVEFLNKTPEKAAGFVEAAAKRMLRELFEEINNETVTVSLKIPKGAEDAAERLGIPLATLCKMVFAVGAESLLEGLVEGFKAEGSC